MQRLFEDRITPAGKAAIQDLIDNVAKAWFEAVKIHGEKSMEADRLVLILASVWYLIGEYEKADPLIRSYVTASEEKCGLYTDEVLCGLILLSNNCIAWGRLEDSRSVLERVKYVSERCSAFRDDPLLEGLYDLAVGCQNAGDPTNEQRGFILLLMALSWCVRYPSDERVYTEYALRLESIFEAYGFVKYRWEWLLQKCNHNLHDLVGLISIFLEKRILPSDAQPPLTAEMREECLDSLVQEFPVHGESELRERILKTGGYPMAVKFICPMCGSRDLRTKFLEPYYPISTLDRVEIDPDEVELCDLYEREPSEYEGVGCTDGWEFWCDKCHLVPKLEQYEWDERQEEQLARWLLDNCPQDEGLPATESGHSKE